MNPAKERVPTSNREVDRFGGNGSVMNERSLLLAHSHFRVGRDLAEERVTNSPLIK